MPAFSHGDEAEEREQVSLHTYFAPGVILSLET